MAWLSFVGGTPATILDTLAGRGGSRDEVLDTRTLLLGRGCTRASPLTLSSRKSRSVKACWDKINDYHWERP